MYHPKNFKLYDYLLCYFIESYYDDDGILIKNKFTFKEFINGRCMELYKINWKNIKYFPSRLLTRDIYVEHYIKYGNELLALNIINEFNYKNFINNKMKEDIFYKYPVFWINIYSYDSIKIRAILNENNIDFSNYNFNSDTLIPSKYKNDYYYKCMAINNPDILLNYNISNIEKNIKYINWNKVNLYENTFLRIPQQFQNIEFYCWVIETKLNETLNFIEYKFLKSLYKKWYVERLTMRKLKLKQICDEIEILPPLLNGNFKGGILYHKASIEYTNIKNSINHC